ncbi:hypothetical protein PENTCL1PPCAC_27496, partial [Pristionchus entomophagus]
LFIGRAHSRAWIWAQYGLLAEQIRCGMRSLQNRRESHVRQPREYLRRQPRRTFSVSYPVLTTRAHLSTEEVRPIQRPMSTTTLADVLYPGTTAPGGPEPQSPPSDLTPNSPSASSPGSDDDGSSRKRSASGSIKEGKERTANKICRVCGDKAYSYNFNVITCESCKAFFRRNANKEKEIRCPFNESCEINVVSRRFCQRCRLFKCFQVGMKKEWIMTDEARLEKKARVEENRERRKEEAKRKDDGSGYHHYRTNSVSSVGSGGGGSAKTSHAAATAAAAAAAVAETASIMQQHQHQHQQQIHHHQQAIFQPDHPTLATTATTHDLLDALAQQAAAASIVQQQQQFPTAALVAAAVAAPPPQPTSSELVAHAIALEQQLQQTQQPTSAATAAAVYQAAAAHHHHQQQQHMAAAAAVAQQIVSMTTPATPLVDMTMAAALALPPPAPPTTAAAAAILNAAVAVNASPLGSLTQAALIMDASAAATQQLQQQLAAVPPPPSALAAVASTMLLPPAQQQSLLQPAAPSLPDRCCCTCQCGKYTNSRTIVDQAQDEWEAEKRGRCSNSSSPSNDMGLSDLLPSASTVSWLNPATNQNPLTEGSLGASTSLPISMSVDDAYPELRELKDSYLRNPLFPPSQQALGLKTIIDQEFGAMQAEDEARLKAVNDANDIAWKGPLCDEENRLHQQDLPSKATMLQMMVGAIKRMIHMSKKFPALRALHPTDQLKLIQGCYLDVMIIRGAMAYDPKENAWKGPTSNHAYNIKMDAMNDDAKTDNMFNQSIRLYTMFKEEYRSDENVMLLLNMIVLFDPNVEGLTDMAAVKSEQNAYKRCLKRLMFTKLNKNQSTVQFEYLSLLERLATVRNMNSGARGIMVEHADSMDPLLKELLGKAEDDHNKVSSKKHSPKAVAPSPSSDKPSPSSKT